MYQACDLRLRQNFLLCEKEGEKTSGMVGFAYFLYK